MRPKYLHEYSKDEVLTIQEVFENLVYKPEWFTIDSIDVKTVIDIGSLVGSFTLWAHEQWPHAKIYSYEPNPQSYELLMKNIQEANVDGRIKSYNIAIWGRDDELQLHRFYDTPGCNSIFEKQPFAGTYLDSITVKAKKLNSIIEEIGSKIDFLKIDCEGSEYEILYNLDKEKLQKIQFIALEYHEFDNNEKNNSHHLLQYLRKSGFAAQLIPVNVEKGKGLGYIYAAQMGKMNDVLNAVFDQDANLIKKYLKLPNELEKKLSQLQGEFDERTKWALKLDTKRIELENRIMHLQNEFENRTKWALELEELSKHKDVLIRGLQTETKDLKDSLTTKESMLSQLQTETKDLKDSLTTKDSQILDLQNLLYFRNSELEALKNSILFKIPFKIARTLDRTFPNGTKRGEALRLARMSVLTAQNEGLGVLGHAAKEKIERQRSIKKSKSHTQILEKPALCPVDKIKPEIIFVFPDHKLREFIKTCSSNILDLPRYPKISIVISTFDQVDLLRRNLASIAKSTYKNYEIIIITNNTDENSEMRKFLKTLECRIVVFNDDYSFSGMNNHASKFTNGEFLLFLNDDVEIISTNWLEALLKLALREDVGVVGPKLLYPNGTLQEAGGIVWKDGIIWNFGRNGNPNEPQFNFVRQVDYCSGACLLVKKDIFEKVGQFDIQYHPAYCEDVDLCLSIQKSGLKIMYQPLASLFHHEGSTQGTNLTTGIKSFQIENQKKFRIKWNEYLQSRSNDSSDNINTERDRNSLHKILYIDHYVPEYDKDAGSLITYYMISILAYEGNKVTFWPDNLNKTEPYTTELQQKGVEVIYGPNNFESFIKDQGKNFQISFVARAHIAQKYIDLIRKYAPNCKIIYDGIDLSFLRELREAKVLNDDVKMSKASQTKNIELELINKSDVAIIKSKEEFDVIKNDISKTTLELIGLCNFYDGNFPTYEERRDLLFLGGFQHPPNVDSLEYLISEIFPKIKEKLPEVKLYVIGSNPPQKVRDMCSKSKDVIFLGYVRDIEQYLKKCRLLLAPLRYGAGVKGKITQSMTYGLPVITTSIGSEGISNENGKVLMISDDANEFAGFAIRAYRDKDLWTTLSLNGKKLSEEKFSPEVVGNTLNKIILKCAYNIHKN